MSKAFILKSPGKMKLTSNKLEPLKEGEVRVKNNFVAISHIDIHHRKGQYELSNLPAVIGVSGSGEITEVGPGDIEFKVGEKVVYATNFLGSYAEEINIHYSKLVGIDNQLAQDVVTAAFLPGLVAHYLVYRTYQVKTSDIAVVNGATGSVGHILCQWLKIMGARTIGIVGSDAKMSHAKNFGCDNVFNSSKEGFTKEVLAATKNVGANVLYDGVGKSAFKDNVEMLGLLGLYVNFGDTSGLMNNFDTTEIWPKALFFTKPNISVYKGNRMELVLSAATLFEAIKTNSIKPHFQTVDFKNIPSAHQEIENRKSIGTIIAKI